MADHIIQVFTTTDHRETLERLAEKQEPIAGWSVSAGRGKIVYHLLVHDNQLQSLIDQLQHAFTKQENWHLIVQPIEAYLPKVKEEEVARKEEDSKKSSEASMLREAMEKELAKGATLDRNYLLLVVFSTLVAAIGMVENNVAVIVGAMVIAPFLGPNLALTFAAAMGNYALVKQALKTLVIGSVTAFALGVLVSRFWQLAEIPFELQARTMVDYSSIVLALASGAAAVLSLTKGIASVLVGVMVAVALLPPLTASALFLGHGYFEAALSALLLLAVNIVCINLSGLLMFIFRGIGPRTWWEKRTAKRSVYSFAAFWCVCLIALAMIIYWRNHYMLF